jgi:hypothetical protein
MTITRKEFLGAATGTVFLLLQACGGGGDGYSSSPAPAPVPAPPPGPPPPVCGSSGAQISGNHGHALVIARADLDSMNDLTYSIVGTADHDHTVTFTPAQLQLLKASQTVTVTSTTTSAHNHNVLASCA